MRRRNGLILSVLLVSFSASNIYATETSRIPPEGEMVESMGFPKKFMPRLGVSYVLDRSMPDRRRGGELNLSVYTDILNPNMGALGIVTELYGGSVGGESRSGARLMGAVRFFMLQAGVDFSFPDEKWSTIWSVQFPLRRGGLLGKGGDIRVDWFPGRDNSLSLGLNIPFMQPYAGKTRPKHAHVSIPDREKKVKSRFSPPEELAGAIADLDSSASLVCDYTFFFSDQEFDLDKEGDVEYIKKGVEEFKRLFWRKDEGHPDGYTFRGVITAYHRDLERAFAIASGGDPALGAEAADLAREVLLEEVLLPYNRLLGQRKKTDSILGFAVEARKRFAAEIDSWPAVDGRGFETLNYLFARLADIVEKNRDILRDEWGQSRLVWLPLHLAYDVDMHDTQDELDSIIEKAVGREFTGGNDVHYVINEQFQWELGRMIHEAEDYHVLWIHDYRGTNNAGDPDLIGYAMTTGGYLRAIIDNVRQYDSAGKMPLYTIILDQFYYEAGRGRLWLELLEDPLDADVRLPEDFAKWEDEIRKLQDELRAAADSSQGLSAGREAYGEDWLKNLLKVHVNITNPADFSFRSGNLFKYMWFVPDIMFRDHRKISFYDITELDPGRGEAIYTGTGVGEHYAGATWDDRAILARGPSVLSLKTEARKVLLSQGFRDDQIPAPLRPLPMPADYDEKVGELIEAGWLATAMELHNKTGFGSKHDNVFKAILYELMPSGSFMIIPDSLWNSAFWGSMLYGAAMRGCRIHVIAPSLKNAPSDGMPQMARANELFTRFLLLSRAFSAELDHAGGSFRVGVYDYAGDVQDMIGRTEAMLRHLDDYDWIGEVVPTHESFRRYLEEALDILAEEGYESTHFTADAEDRKPKMHFKTQLFTSAQLNGTVLPLEGWGPLFRDYILARAEQSAHSDSYVDAKKLREGVSRSGKALLREWAESMSAEDEERLVMYLSLGSQNQDYRGKIMDGEVLFIVSGLSGALGYLDMMNLMLITTWVEDLDSLDAIMPPFKGYRQRLSRYIKLAL